MASTPQGKVMTPVLCHLRYAIYLPVFLLSLLPARLKECLVQLVLRNLRSLDTTTIPATISLIDVDCAGESIRLRLLVASTSSLTLINGPAVIAALVRECSCQESVIEKRGFETLLRCFYML